MAKKSVSQNQSSISASQVRRRWQEHFRQRMQEIALPDWRCVGVDIGKYEHVAVITDGFGELLAKPRRFGVYQKEMDDFFDQVDTICSARDQRPVVGMEPTGYYYEQLAHEAAKRFGQEQVYLIQSYDTSQRRKIWNRGSFKNDEVDACIVAELMREGHGRPYRPPQGVYTTLYHLERYRFAREQAATRLKNQIIGHVYRLYPGMVIRNKTLRKQYQAMFYSMWNLETPRRLVELFPDPYQLREQTPESLFTCFREAGYWMNRPYAAKIIAKTRNLCLPDPALVAIRSKLLLKDLKSLASTEKQVADTEEEMARCLDQTWATWLRPTKVAPYLLASLAATIGDIRQYHSARQIFGRSGLHSGCQDSGTRQRRGQGGRIVAPGDRHLRRQLVRFSFAMTTVRHPALQRYQAKLLKKGLCRTSAQIAIARRLTGIIFAVATKQEPFDPARFA